MKKRLGFCTLLLTSSALMLGLFAFNSKQEVAPAKAVTSIEDQINSVQMRTGGSGLNYLVVIDNNINPYYYPVGIAGDGYNAPDYINVYLSPSANPIKLADIIDDSQNWKINLWQSGGVMFPLSDDNYDLYNGTTVYAIEILEGCTYPNFNMQQIVAQSTKKYINKEYGQDSARDFAIEWQEPTKYEDSGVPITFGSAQARADVDASLYYICFCSSSFFEAGFVEYGDLSAINAYDKIRLYLTADDEVGKTLGEITNIRRGCQDLWTSGAMHFAISADEFEIYNGTTIYKMTIDSGCQMVLNNQLVHAPRDYTFYNNTYGDPSAKNSGFYFFPAAEPITEPILLMNAQVRADVGSGFYFIDIRSEAYTGTPEIGYSNLGALNTYSHIKIHLSEDDQGILLGNVTTLRSGYQNLWTSSAMLFSLSAAEFEVYNGTTIYAIEVLSGCELYVSNSPAVVDKDYRFINNDYGKASAKYEAFNFSLEVDALANLGEIGVIGVHNRMDKASEYRWIMFMLDSNIYNVNLGVDKWINELNMLDNIFIFLNETDNPLTLRDIYDPSQTGVTLRLFGQNNMLGVSILNGKVDGKYPYCGPKMYKIVIETGTQFPTYEDGVAGYRTINEKTVLVNDDYGLSGDIPDGGMDDEGNPRIYEEWNVNWTVASCYVTFKVVGIEGLSFPDMLLEYGQRVSLETFAQDGYDLTVTTSDGAKVYQYIIGTNHNLDFTLTYTPTKGGSKNINMTAIIIIAAVGGTVLVAGGVVAAILIIKKRKGKTA